MGVVDVVVRREMVFSLSEVLGAEVCDPSIRSRKKLGGCVEERTLVLQRSIAKKDGVPGSSAWQRVTCHGMRFGRGS